MKDGHVHSPYCPHGSNDDFEDYIKNAIEAGLTEITFTEHLPLPNEFVDPSPEKDSAMKIESIDCYIDTVKKLKERYRDKIKINVGVEVDYLEGYEEEIKYILDKYGSDLDDSIISVHMINVRGQYCLIDYSVEEFGKLISILDGVENVYTKYYQTIKNAIDSDLGKYKPKRIGHLNIVRKFNKVFPYDYSSNLLLEEVVKSIRKNRYEVDYNIAGYRKEECKEAYISGALLDLIEKYEIPMVLGSDSHQAQDIKFYKSISGIENKSLK